MFNFFREHKLCGSVSILIPTMFDSRYIIELCLESIWKYADYPDYQIIVCDAGVDDVTRDYLIGLQQEKRIRLIKATDWERPKDDLVDAVDSEYYILMHDDTQILKKGWLTRRLVLMNRDKRNAVVGSIVKNYNFKKRFFPLGLLVKTEVSKKLGLKWGKRKGFDTGALAYEKFFSQSEYKYVLYKVSRDIRHFSEMTWPKYHDPSTYKGLDKKLEEREAKIATIREILERKAY